MSEVSDPYGELPREQLTRFFEASAERFKRRPQVIEYTKDLPTRAAIFGLTAAVVDYFFLTDILGANRSLHWDEVSAIFALVAGVLFGSIQRAPYLCHADVPKKVRRWRIWGAGGAGGLAGGAAIAALIPVLGVVAAPVAAVALVVGGVVVGVGGVTAYQHALRTKNCPHCGYEGKCNQRVCRQCHRLFYPEDVIIDCSNTLLLDWYTIASYLQKQGLNFFDAKLLVEENIHRWRHPWTRNKELRIDCESFMKWISSNREQLASYIGSAEPQLKEPELRRLLVED